LPRKLRDQRMCKRNWKKDKNRDSSILWWTNNSLKAVF